MNGASFRMVTFTGVLYLSPRARSTKLCSCTTIWSRVSYEALAGLAAVPAAAFFFAPGLGRLRTATAPKTMAPTTASAPTRPTTTGIARGVGADPPDRGGPGVGGVGVVGGGVSGEGAIGEGPGGPAGVGWGVGPA